jgi:hypothetical protein
MDLGLEDRRKKEETAAVRGQGGARRRRGRGWRGDREARGGGEGRRAYRRAEGVLGVYLYVTPGCIQYREYTWVHFSAAVYIYTHTYIYSIQSIYLQIPLHSCSRSISNLVLFIHNFRLSLARCRLKASWVVCRSQTTLGSFLYDGIHPMGEI